MEKHTHYLGLVCVFVGVATLLFARNRFHRTAAARNTLVLSTIDAGSTRAVEGTR